MRLTYRPEEHPIVPGAGGCGGVGEVIGLRPHTPRVGSRCGWVGFRNVACFVDFGGCRFFFLVCVRQKEEREWWMGGWMDGWTGLTNVWTLCPTPPSPLPHARSRRNPEAIVLQRYPTKPADHGGWRRVGARKGSSSLLFSRTGLLHMIGSVSHNSGDTDMAASDLAMAGGGSDRDPVVHFCVS